MSVYGSLAQWYDWLTRDVPYNEFADFYEEIFAGHSGNVSSVLDLACGTATLSCILAKRGYDIVAVDSSADMLAEAVQKIAELPQEQRPLFLCQQMPELDLYGTVDAAVCSLDGMNYVPPGQLREVFRRLSLFIVPGGLLIFDINSPDRLRELDGELFCDESDDLLCLWRADFDEDDRALFYYMDIFSRSGSVWLRDTEEHVEYAHDPGELTALLEESGFCRISIRSDAVHAQLGRLFIIAENNKAGKE